METLSPYLSALLVNSLTPSCLLLETVTSQLLIEPPLTLSTWQQEIYTIYIYSTRITFSAHDTFKPLLLVRSSMERKKYINGSSFIYRKKKNNKIIYCSFGREMMGRKCTTWYIWFKNGKENIHRKTVCFLGLRKDSLCYKVFSKQEGTKGFFLPNEGNGQTL